MIGGFLIVRREGVLWGLPAERVATIERLAPSPAESQEDSAADSPERSDTARFAVHLAGGDTLAVDAVLTLAADLRVQPLTRRLRRFLPAGASGLALLAGEPLVLLALRAEAPHA